MNEQELAEIKERYAKLGDEDANVIHRLLEKIEQLNTEIGLVVKEALADQALLGEMIAGAGQVNAEMEELRGDNIKIENYYEYFLTFDKAAAELRRLEAEKDHDIENYYLIGFSLDGQTKSLTFDELKTAIFGDEREAMFAEIERRRHELVVMLNERLIPLEKENARLREALEKIVGRKTIRTDNFVDMFLNCVWIAEQALKGGSQ